MSARVVTSRSFEELSTSVPVDMYFLVGDRRTNKDDNVGESCKQTYSFQGITAYIGGD